MTDQHHYLLGHTEHELARLDVQGRLYRDTTLHSFREAGLGPGMRVLDIGCGTGDVTLTAAELVGPTGMVLGIDRGAGALETARAKAAAMGVENVRFEQTELDAFEQPDGFDALVGRFILMHQPDPAATLGSLTRSIRPGGSIVILESWMDLIRTGGHSQPFSPLYEEIVQWKSAVVSGAGADLYAGGRLRSIFLAAGLAEPTTRLDALVAGGSDSPYYEYVEQSVRSMLPEARRQALPGFDEASTVGLASRLRDEVTAQAGSLIGWPTVAAWSRTPE